MIEVRAAVPADAEAMCAVINPLIAAGGTTAHRTPFDAARMAAYFLEPERFISCVVAEAPEGILGFQALEWVPPGWIWADRFPDATGAISSFVAPEGQGRGLGRALFEATSAQARAAGAQALEATIRLENGSGRGYYAAMGFVDQARDAERVVKRFDL